MILVDTNIIIEYLRTTNSKLLGLFRSLPGCICGTIRAEVLHGSRNLADRNRYVTILDSFAQTSTPEAVWDKVGDLLSVLRANGITIPFNDVVIACVSISAGAELWTRDNQFKLIQQLEPQLLLFQEPP